MLCGSWFAQSRLHVTTQFNTKTITTFISLTNDACSCNQLQTQACVILLELADRSEELALSNRHDWRQDKLRHVGFLWGVKLWLLFIHASISMEAIHDQIPLMLFLTYLIQLSFATNVLNVSLLASCITVALKVQYATFYRPKLGH